MPMVKLNNVKSIWRKILFSFLAQSSCDLPPNQGTVLGTVFVQRS